MTEVNHQKIRRFQLCEEKIETLEDVKKILGLLNIRIETNNPEWDNVKDYFCLEVIPRGYFKLLEKIGHEEIAKLDYNEIERQSFELLNDGENN